MRGRRCQMEESEGLEGQEAKADTPQGLHLTSGHVSFSTWRVLEKTK